MEEIRGCKVKLISGDPLIGKAAFTDNGERFIIEIVVPGAEQGTIMLRRDDSMLVVEQEDEFEYSKPFKVAFMSDVLDFKSTVVDREHGVLYINSSLKKSQPEFTSYITV